MLLEGNRKISGKTRIAARDRKMPQGSAGSGRVFGCPRAASFEPFSSSLRVSVICKQSEIEKWSGGDDY